MKCPKCQFENREGAKFCKKCGNKLEQKCPSCGTPYQTDSLFCDECGHDLRASKEAPPIDFNQPQSYTPKFLADKILTSRSTIEGERKLVTVLFADVANYTAMSEKLDPEEVHQIMDGCFKILMDEIHKYEGTINQFTGDGVMALFGAPIAHEDHALRACHASLAIQTAMLAFSRKLKKDLGIVFQVRIGINTGPVVVGSIGDDLRMDYTAQGDTVNQSSRMESHAEPGTVLISANTYRLVKEYFEFESKGTIQVKGKEAALEAYQLLRSGEIETRMAASAARGLTRFVGRRQELEALEGAYKKVQSGQGQVVGIVGEAGVGKSRLLFELGGKLPRGEYTYLEGHCLHYGSAMPYLPILDVFRSFVGIKEGDPELAIRKKIRKRILGLDENLSSVVPPFQDLLSLKVDDAGYARLEPKQKREKTFEAIRDLLIRGSQERPIVLAVEDLHWIDKTSEEFLDYMIGWLPNTRILVILLYRPEYTHPWGSKSYYSKVGVGQLSSGTSTELVRAILEGGEMAPEIRDLILGRASGNPFFMEELTYNLLENGTIRKQADRYVLKSGPGDIQVPDTVQGVIAARMDRLEEGLKSIMQVAAVIGREFAFRILHAISEVKADLKSQLLNLQGLEFIYEKRLFPELEYIFRHALTQEVAYNSLLVKRRKEIHEKIGLAIEELYPQRLEEFYEMLAYHYSKSENISKACHFLKLSGDKAGASFSTLEAFQSYRQAVDLLRDQPVTPDNRRVRLEILQPLARHMIVLGYPEGSLELLQEGETMAQDLKDGNALAYFQSNMGFYYVISGNDAVKGRKYLEKGLEWSEPTADVGIIAPATSDLIVSYSVEGNYARICQVTPKIIALIEKTHTERELFGRPDNIYSALHSFYGLSLGGLGRFAEGEPFLEKGLFFARDMNNLISLAAVEMNYGLFYLQKGDGEKSVKHLQSSIEYIEKSQFHMLLGLVWALLGRGYWLSGRIDKAIKCAEKGLEINTDLGIPFLLGTIHNTLGNSHLEVGNFEKAMVHAEQALDLSRKNNEKSYEAEASILLGRVIASTERKQFDQAREQILKGISMHEEQKRKPAYAIGLLYLGEIYAAADQPEGALENLKKAETLFQEMGMVFWPDKAREILAAL